MTAPSDPIRLAIFASGSGTNFEAIVQAAKTGRIPRVHPVLLVCDRPGAGVLDRAKRLDIPVYLSTPSKFPSKDDYEAAILQKLKSDDVHSVALAGYMRLVGPNLINAYPNRILNIHPSLLPAFPGLHAQRQAVAYGVKVSGVTVHYVDIEMDHGPILVQKAVPVLEGDTEESLTLRIREAEHAAYEEALRIHSEGRGRLVGRTIRVSKGNPS
jgi:phosphoribosylglycinamide formyltransferase-1